MVSNEVRNYLSTRYHRFLEYADYHAGLAHLDQQGGDVLNEVLLSFLSKDPEFLQRLYNKKGKGGYREIDFYILRMVKLNCHSATSPYRFKYRSPCRDENAEMPRLDENDDNNGDSFYDHWNVEDLVDEPYEETDTSEIICLRFQMVREVLVRLPIPEREKEIFRHKFFNEQPWNEWKGKEKTRQLQTIFKRVKHLIIAKIDRLRISYMGVIARSQKRIEKYKLQYKWTLFPGDIRYNKKYRQALEVKKKYESLLNQITRNHE